MHLSEQNRQLWERVSAFDIAEYSFNYGFALRLATENKWSFSFTDTAIMEYKKFMFLAAISEEMVAPAAIVDTVWHLHLIYSDAYQSFCKLLGKEIKHIPSRKQAGESSKFHAAKLSTQKIYEPVFGTMPEAIWQYENMYDSMNLSRASYSPGKINILTLVLFPVLVAVLYFLLRPVYGGVDSAYFLPAYFVLGIIILSVLRQHNNRQFKQWINRADASGFLFQLGSLELITLKSGKVKECIHALSNELVLSGNIDLGSFNRLSVIHAPGQDKIALQQLFDVFDQFESPVVYDKILSKAMHIPYFQAIQTFADQLRHYINTSRQYLHLVLLNYSLLGAFLALGLVRIFTGLSVGKPISYILFLVFIFIVLAGYLLQDLRSRFFHKILPDHYFQSPVFQLQEPQWAYLESGRLALTAAFIPVVSASIATDHHASSGGSCGTSCGSSCGSSCGGCGGD